MIYEPKWLYWKPNYPAVKGDLGRVGKDFNSWGMSISTRQDQT